MDKLCEECNGTGRVRGDTDDDLWICSECDGTGWIEAPDEEDEDVPESPLVVGCRPSTKPGEHAGPVIYELVGGLRHWMCAACGGSLDAPNEVLHT
jgi:hypothetical protein